MLIINNRQYDEWSNKDYTDVLKQLSNITPVDLKSAAAILQIHPAELLFAIYNSSGRFTVIPDNFDSILNLQRVKAQNVNVKMITIDKGATVK